MFKTLAIATVFVATVLGGSASARMEDPATNQPSYWETSSTVCNKIEMTGKAKYTYSVPGNDVAKVVVKGGSDYSTYTSGPFVDLRAPVNERNNKNFAISHVIICRDNGAGQGETDTTQPTTPDKPEKPVTPVKPDVPASEKADKVTICHGTGSATNPYVKISVSRNALGGHFNEMDTPRAGHLDDIMLDSADDDCPTAATETDPEALVDNDDDDQGEVASGETTRKEDGKGAGAAQVESATDDRPASLPVTGAAAGVISIALFAGAVAAGSTVLARRFLFTV
jgi:hypothetical protein